MGQTSILMAEAMHTWARMMKQMERGRGRGGKESRGRERRGGREGEAEAEAEGEAEWMDVASRWVCQLWAHKLVHEQSEPNEVGLCQPLQHHYQVQGHRTLGQPPALLPGACCRLKQGSSTRLPLWLPLREGWPGPPGVGAQGQPEPPRCIRALDPAAGLPNALHGSQLGAPGLVPAPGPCRCIPAG